MPETTLSSTPEQHEVASAEAGALGRRARLGMLALGLRSVLQQVTTLVANVYLARRLSPADYGVFAIVQFAMALFTIFGDVGLAPSLVQKESVPTEDELSTVWWFQIGLSVTIVTSVYLASPLILQFWPGLPEGSEWLLRGLALTFLFTVLRVVPSLLLERSLRFGAVSLVEFGGTLAFYGTAVVMAHNGARAASLVTATLVQAVTSTIALNLIRPWRPRWAFNMTALRSMLRFGIAYQGKVIAGFSNTSVTPIIAGTRLGEYGLGLVNFAQNTAWFPLQLVAIVGRVSFPMFSRLQNDRQALAREVERAVLLCATATLFFVALCLGIGPKLVTIIYSDQWAPALPALYVYALAITFGFLSPVVAAVLEALGKPQIMFRLAMGWMLLNWLAVIVATSISRTPLAFALGYSVHVVLGNLAVVVVLKRLLPEVRLTRRLRACVLAAVVAALFGRWALLPWLTTGLLLTAAVLCLALVFVAIAVWLDRSLLGAIRSLSSKGGNSPR
jgi:O-antigen/teichoic acid export membrane protein